MKKQLISILILALLPMVAYAASIEDDGIYYELSSNNNRATVTSNPNKYKGDIIIPKVVKYNEVYYDVTSIGLCAFQDCTDLTSVTIPTTITSIGKYAFQGCSGLADITIPNSVTTIGDRAFRACKSLTNVTIGNSVTSIGEFAFHECSNLKSIVIPNSVTTIGKWAFSSCSALTNITLGNSVEIIEDAVFADCPGQAEIIIPDCVTTIKWNAFARWTNLTSVYFGKSVTVLGESPFIGCDNLENIVVDAYNEKYTSEEGSNAIIDKTTHQLVYGCKNTVIPNNVTSIGAFAFNYCIGLTSIDIPNSVNRIGYCAFDGCSGLTSITIPNSVTVIESMAFSRSIGLGAIYCLSENPPQASEDIIDFYAQNNITLFVPESAIDDYAAVTPWKKFKRAVLPKYNLTYTIDGVTHKTYNYEMGKSVQAEPAPEKEGYTFLGWSEEPEVMPAHDVEVTGSFEVNTYKLIYIVDGVEYMTSDVEYGTVIAPELAPKKDGYIFAEWSGLPETMPAQDVTVNATYVQSLGKCTTPTIALKDGEFKFESEDEGVEFEWSFNIVGNSGNGSKASAPTNFVVSVYATKDHYEDSDTATMEMDMRSTIGDVSGDNKVDATDLTKLIEILLKR